MGFGDVRQHNFTAANMFKQGQRVEKTAMCFIVADDLCQERMKACFKRLV
jgi:hypothetical protein